MVVVDFARVTLYNLRSTKELNITGCFPNNKNNSQFFQIEQGLTQFRRFKGQTQLIIIAMTKVMLENG
jgi:hypothetical protein